MIEQTSSTSLLIGGRCVVVNLNLGGDRSVDRIAAKYLSPLAAKFQRLARPSHPRSCSPFQPPPSNEGVFGFRITWNLVANNYCSSSNEFNDLRRKSAEVCPTSFPQFLDLTLTRLLLPTRPLSTLQNAFTMSHTGSPSC